MVKYFLQARQLYSQLLDIIKNVEDSGNSEEYINIFKMSLKKFISILNKIDINYIDVSPSTRSNLIKEFNQMIDDVEAFKWQLKYWSYEQPLKNKAKWIQQNINDALRKDFAKKGLTEPYDIPISKINDFIYYLINFDNLDIYENDIKRIIRGSYTEAALYRLYNSCKYSITNNFNNLEFKNISDVIYTKQNLIKTYNNKLISSDDLKLIYGNLIKDGWKLLSIQNSKFNSYLNKNDLFHIYNFISKNKNDVKIKFYYNKSINNLLGLIKIDDNFLLKFIDLDNENWYDDFKSSIIDKYELNEGFINPFVNNDKVNNTLENKSDFIKINKPSLIKDVKLWDSNKRLNQIKYFNKKMYANTNFYKDDIVEEAPVIILSNEDLYTKNVRNIVFDISPNKFGIPLGYTSLYRKSSDTNKESNLDYKYDIENNKLIFIAKRNISEGEELIIDVNKTIYDNQLKEDSFVDSMSPSVYDPSEIGIVNIKALSTINSGYPPISGGM